MLVNYMKTQKTNNNKLTSIFNIFLFEPTIFIRNNNSMISKSHRSYISIHALRVRIPPKLTLSNIYKCTFNSSSRLFE